MELSNNFDEVFFFDHPFNNRGKKYQLVKFYEGLKSFIQCYRYLRTIPFDLAIDFRPFYPNASFLFYLLKTSYRIGFDSGGLSHLFNQAISWEDGRCYLLESYQEMLSQIGIQKEIGLNQKFGMNVDSVLPDVLGEKIPYIIFHPACDESSRNWEEKNWLELADQLDKKSFRILVTGKGKEQFNFAKKLEEKCGKVENFVDKLSIKDLYGLAEKAKAVVTVDSMMTHLTALTTTPLITIYKNYNLAKIWGPTRDRSYRVYSKTGLIEDVPVSMVYEKIDKILKD